MDGHATIVLLANQLKVDNFWLHVLNFIVQSPPIHTLGLFAVQFVFIRLKFLVISSKLAGDWSSLLLACSTALKTP